MADIDTIIEELETEYFDSGKLKRQVYYEAYNTSISNQLDRYETLKEKIDYLISNIRTINQTIYSFEGTINDHERQRKILELQTDILNQHIENINLNTKLPKLNNTDYSYYPTLDNDTFNNDIYQKKEFYRNKSPPLEDRINNPLDNLGFRRSTSQKFVKNYISPATPYNGLLLYHEVGVGKTCAAIGIAEGFRDYITENKKILVLTPSETLVDNWRNEILNIDKELKKNQLGSNKNEQCTGSRYLNEIPNPEYDNREKFRKQSRKIIKKYYEFMGYQKLANLIKKNIELKSTNRKNTHQITIQYIRDRFSNLVIIMDEVHETRIGDNSNKDKLVVPWLEMIARYAINTKIILLTATPMYNISSEIVWIMNLLLLNDKKAPIQEHLIFDKIENDYQFKNTEEAKNYFNSKTRGYISYVRGEDPISFPIKIDPQGSSIANAQYKIEKGKLIPIDDSERSQLKTVPSNMSMWQFKEFSKISNTTSTDVDSFKAGFPVAKIQASNIIFPDPNTIGTDHMTGGVTKASFDKCFQYSKTNKQYTMDRALKDYSRTKSFMHRNNIGEFSAKFKTIIDSILSCKGIVFVYSDYLTMGVKSLALALECNGFNRMSYKSGKAITENLLSNPDNDTQGFCSRNNDFFENLSTAEQQNFKKASYILLEGSTAKSELDALVKEARGEGYRGDNNTYGEHIKVILGSEVVKQGISFKNVRETHILEPWFHLNEMKQASGRAVRRGSHNSLPSSERNVSIYLHISTIPKVSDGYTGENIELIDEKTYRKAFSKLRNMAIIDRLIKENAVDCQLNKNINYYSRDLYTKLPNDPFSEREVVDSKGNTTRVELYDKDYSEKCNFQLCDYTCKNIDREILDEADVDYSTFNINFANDDVMLIKEYIKTLFSSNYILTDTQIIEDINHLFSSEAKDKSDSTRIDERFIYIALDSLIKNRDILFDEQMKKGYIIEVDDYYIFQPIEIKDLSIPIKYRYIPNYKYTKSFYLDEITKPVSLSPITRPKNTKKLIKKSSSQSKDIIDWTSMLKEYTSLAKYVRLNYSDLNEMSSKYPLAPSFDDITKYLFQSYFESNISNEIRKQIFMFIIHKYNTDPDKLNLIEKIILEYYYIPSKYRTQTDKFTYMIDEGHLDSSMISETYNKIVAFIWIADGTFDKFYLYDESLPNKFKNLPTVLKDDYKDFTLREPSYDNTEYGKIFKLSEIYGYNEEKRRSIKFHVINKLDGKYTKEMERSKKTRRKGAVCGTAAAATKKNELVDFIKLIFKSMDIDDKRYNSKKNIPNKTSSKNGEKKNLCEEIEILLRHRDGTKFYGFTPSNNKFSRVTYDNRYFYRLDEKMSLQTYFSSDD